jgi:V4R domain-containing protein
VRASFRRFFPASSATLVPERTLLAIRNIWSRYHTWGSVTSIPVQPTETIIQIGTTLRNPQLCEWTSGMLETLVTLSGGAETAVEHVECEARGDAACRFQVRWDRQE